jgi:hypothetical protein
LFERTALELSFGLQNLDCTVVKIANQDDFSNAIKKDSVYDPAAQPQADAASPQNALKPQKEAG